MTIATKNGAVILKDGILAQSCDCCADRWYCCSEIGRCGLANEIAVSVTVSASDYMFSRSLAGAPCGGGSGSLYYQNTTNRFLGSHYSGTFNLAAFQQFGLDDISLRYTYPVDPVGCTGAYVSVNAFRTGGSIRVALTEIRVRLYSFDEQGIGYGTLLPPAAVSEMRCTNVVERNPPGLFAACSGGVVKTRSQQLTPLLPQSGVFLTEFSRCAGVPSISFSSSHFLITSENTFVPAGAISQFEQTGSRVVNVTVTVTPK